MGQQQVGATTEPTNAIPACFAAVLCYGMNMTTNDVYQTKTERAAGSGAYQGACTHASSPACHQAAKDSVLGMVC